MQRLLGTSAIAAIAAIAALGLPGCGATMYESDLRRDLITAEAGLAPAPDLAGRDPLARDRGHPHGGDHDDDALPALDGSLEAYQAYALRRHPELRAAFEAWRAQSLRIGQARRLPDPTLSYGYFLRRMEGIERQRIALSQPIPWPGKRAAGADAADAGARAGQARFQAQAQTVRRRVAEAYWQLWLVRRTRAIQQEQKHILQGLAASLRGRVEIGRASLADLAQLDLSTSRIDDALIGLDEEERAASARLIAALGAPPATATPTTATPPAATMPAASEDALRQAALAHPRIQALDLVAEAQDAQARRAAADRYPDLGVGIEYMDMAGEGKDPIMAMLMVKLPLWRGAYADAARAARAEGASQRAQSQAARDRAAFELTQVLSRLRDAARRIHLYTHTLVPQAETVYGSVIGGYETDRQSIASVMLAQRDLLELRLGLARTRRDHAMARAELEDLVGGPVDLIPAAGPPAGSPAPSPAPSTSETEVTP